MLPRETLLDLDSHLHRLHGRRQGPGEDRLPATSSTGPSARSSTGFATGKTPEDRSGVIWHTQGSGKSLTMVFVIRKLRMCDDLKDYKVCLVNDRTDLEEQLGETAELTGEKVTYIASSDDLKAKLKGDGFQPEHGDDPQVPGEPEPGLARLSGRRAGRSADVRAARAREPSERILLMIDEAHRTQSGDLGDNLFEAFPDATRLAFTGTPLIEVKDGKEDRGKRFGEYIDKYKLQDAVDDGATVQILYEGKTADTAVKDKAEVRREGRRTGREARRRRRCGKPRTSSWCGRSPGRENRPFDDLVKERPTRRSWRSRRSGGPPATSWKPSTDRGHRRGPGATLRREHPAERLQGPGRLLLQDGGGALQEVHRRGRGRAVGTRNRPSPMWTGDPKALPEEDRAELPGRRTLQADRLPEIGGRCVLRGNQRAGGHHRRPASTARKSDAVENFKRRSTTTTRRRSTRASPS